VAFHLTEVKDYVNRLSLMHPICSAVATALAAWMATMTSYVAGYTSRVVRRSGNAPVVLCSRRQTPYARSARKKNTPVRPPVVNRLSANRGRADLSFLEFNSAATI
jgi:hypothetical protein